MWIGKIEDLIKCEVLEENVISSVLAFIKNNDMQSLPDGSYDLGNGNFVNIFEYDTKESDGVFETHKKYVDIHYPIIGEEKILWASAYERETQSYQAEDDYSLGTVRVPQEIEMNGGLCVFLPNEPHKAGVALRGSVKVKKAVFKVVNTKA